MQIIVLIFLFYLLNTIISSQLEILPKFLPKFRFLVEFDDLRKIVK